HRTSTLHETYYAEGNPMSTMWTAVTLRTDDVLGQTFVVVVKRDQHGHVPTVLVNPIDTAGRRLPGVWLSEASHHTVYRRLPENPSL
ncbi:MULTISPECIES: hypothetical protein, partial [unclassified Cryobacterium]